MSHLFYLSQTITTLNLEFNQIGAVDAQVIGQALKRNRMK